MSDKINRLIQEASIDKERAARLLEEMAVMETQIEELRAALADERKRALEEAARIADEVAADAQGDEGKGVSAKLIEVTASVIAAAIRSLMEKPE